jgi:CheY-like chemotaxis protein
VDLLISDVGLPDMNGIKLAEAARKHNPALEIVIASGRSPPLREELEKLAGRPIRWLLKPFTTEQLVGGCRVREGEAICIPRIEICVIPWFLRNPKKAICEKNIR